MATGVGALGRLASVATVGAAAERGRGAGGQRPRRALDTGTRMPSALSIMSIMIGTGRGYGTA